MNRLLNILKGLKNLKNQNELFKAWFAHDDPYADRKELARRTVSGKVLKDRAYRFVSNSKCYGYQKGLAASVNEVLAKELHRPVIKRRKSLCEVYR